RERRVFHRGGTDEEHPPAGREPESVLAHHLVRETADAHDLRGVHRCIYDKIRRHDAVRICLRRALGRRPEAPRRQGSRPRRDDAARRAGAGRLHDRHGRVPRVHARRRRGARRPGRGDRRAHRAARGEDRQALRRAVVAVFESWSNPRAEVYRRTYGIPDDLGTAVNVVQMVFGNKGDRSATGVCFTRNPSTGEQGVYGEYLVNAQGEDVVAGIRTPQPVEEMRERLPEAYDQLLETMTRLEQHYRDVQDIEFTVEEGRLYLLQTRSAKRTAAAALKAAVDMTTEGLIEREEAVSRT